MLEIRPNCECCDCDLSPDSNDVFICSFECTFCLTCKMKFLNELCPNCGGELVKRPTRSIEKLIRYPPSNKRIYNPDCINFQINNNTENTENT